MSTQAFCPITLVVPLINMKDEFATKDLSSLISCWSKGVELCDFPRVQFSILCPPNPFAKGQNVGTFVGEGISKLNPLSQSHPQQVNSQALVIRASRKDFKMMLAASDAATKLLFKDREVSTASKMSKLLDPTPSAPNFPCLPQNPGLPAAHYGRISGGRSHQSHLRANARRHPLPLLGQDQEREWDQLLHQRVGQLGDRRHSHHPGFRLLCLHLLEH